MTYSVNEVNNILKTLPIGYYVGKNVEVTLNESADCSSFDLMNMKIEISYHQIVDTLKSCKEDEIESAIRSNLYHEVSHAILTPKTLTPSREMNIFEDERIETILKHYYLNVNFKEMVKKMNGFTGEIPKSADDAFYQLVRYRIGSIEWLTRLENLINKYRTLTRNTDEYDSYDYSIDVKNFYNDFISEWKPKGNTKTNSEQSNNESNEEINENEETKTSTEFETSDEINDEELKSELAEIKELISNVVNTFVDTKLSEQLNSILARISSSNKRNGSAINSYSGIFDPRSVARNDYKYFVQKNRLGNVKMYSKNHLNLFIDVSGSFWNSEMATNKLLYALHKFEKANQDFTFDVVTINTSVKLLNKNERTIKCGGGNKLPDYLHEIVKKLQYSDRNVYNIVMFDGDAVSDEYFNKASALKNFSAFNLKNLTIISDLSNEKAIRKYCSAAKQIFTNRYAKELIANVLKSLEMFAR